jgi:8-amino-7-oxononanoate synthase
MNLLSRIERELQQRKKNAEYRTLPAVKHGADFFSNDYLGYTRLIPQYRKNIFLNIPSGSTGSRLLSGNFPEAEELEKFIAEIHLAESAVLFSSGYLANFGLMSTLASRHDVYLYDELCHASIIDGIRHSPASSFKYRHNDGKDLVRLLSKFSGSADTIFIVTETLFSMDGDYCLLPEWKEILEKFENLCLIADEAHALGTSGKDNLGLLHKVSFSFPLIRIFTYGKALGGMGASVTGPAWLREYLVNFCRPFIYTTAPSPDMVHNIRTGYELLLQKVNTTKLHENIDFLLAEMRKFFATELHKSPVQIFPMTQEKFEQKTAEHYLEENGISCRWIRYPTVSKGKERFRITVHAYNTDEEIRRLVQCLKDISSAEQEQE